MFMILLGYLYFFSRMYGSFSRSFHLAFFSVCVCMYVRMFMWWCLLLFCKNCFVHKIDVNNKKNLCLFWNDIFTCFHSTLSIISAPGALLSVIGGLNNDTYWKKEMVNWNEWIKMCVYSIYGKKKNGKKIDSDCNSSTLIFVFWGFISKFKNIFEYDKIGRIWELWNI